MRNTMIKKLLLNGGKWETAQGVPPLTLEKSLGKDLRDYKIYGNSIQNGTPTPDTPVEVESVGEKTKNLFDIDTYGKNSNTDNGRYIDISQYEVGTKLTISIKDNIYQLKIANSASSTAILKADRVTSFSFTMSQEYKDCGRLYIISLKTYMSETIENLRNQNVQLEYGNTATPYEPYGYKIPVVAQGKNLFDINTYGNYTDIYKYPYVLDISHYAVGTKITISTNDIYLYKISNSSGGAGTYQVKSNKHTYTLTQAMIDLKYLFIISPKTYLAETKENLMAQNVQIEYGDTATDFEPYVEPIETNIYLDEPLRKIGNYADCIDFENGNVVRHITEEKALPDGKINFSNAFALRPQATPLNQTIMCNHLLSTTSMPVAENRSGKIFINVGKTYIGLGETDLFPIAHSTPTEAEILVFNEWVTNNNVLMYYILATPTETQIELPKLPTLKGATVLDTNTNLALSNMSVVYKRR